MLHSKSTTNRSEWRSNSVEAAADACLEATQNDVLSVNWWPPRRIYTRLVQSNGMTLKLTTSERIDSSTLTVQAYALPSRRDTDGQTDRQTRVWCVWQGQGTNAPPPLNFSLSENSLPTAQHLGLEVSHFAEHLAAKLKFWITILSIHISAVGNVQLSAGQFPAPNFFNPRRRSEWTPFSVSPESGRDLHYMQIY